MKRHGIWGLALIAAVTVIAVAAIGPAGTEDVPVSRGDGDMSAGPTGGYASGTGATPAPDAEIRFVALTRQIFSELPRKSELRGLSDADVHGAPEPVQNAGRLLGRVARVLVNDSSLAPQAAAFYQDCATSGEFLQSVRALCYANLVNVAEKRAELGIRLEPKTIPAEVRELAARLKGWQ